MYKLEPFPMSISSASSWCYFSIHLLWLVHFVFCYVKCFEGAYGLDNIFIAIYRLVGTYSSVGLAINSIMVAVIFFSIMFPKMEKEAGVLFLFEYLGSQAYPYLRYLIELALYSTSFFLFKVDVMNWVLFVLAATAATISTTLLQNFTLRKDEFCCKSVNYSLIWRAVLITSLVVGVVGANGIDSGSSLIVWTLG